MKEGDSDGLDEAGMVEIVGFGAIGGDHCGGLNYGNQFHRNERSSIHGTG